jgi:hypothetical protein
LERPSEREPVQHYATVSDGLYDAILERTLTGANVVKNAAVATETKVVTGAGVR